MSKTPFWDYPIGQALVLCPHIDFVGKACEEQTLFDLFVRNKDGAGPVEHLLGTQNYVRLLAFPQKSWKG